MSTELGTQPSSIAMIRTLGGIAMLSGILIVLVYQITLPMIMENKRIALEAAVFKVIPNAVSKVSFVLTPDELIRLDDMSTGTIEGEKIYVGYDKNKQLAGIAMEAEAPGYQDTVQTLYGYSPTCECIIGMTVLQSKETPGLGDKVETDPKFLANFKALDAKLNVDKTALIHPITTVRHGKKTQAWQIDAISGATVTSKAIGKGLNNSTQKLLPMLSKRLGELPQIVAE
ncbi:FMN-binding protein [Candidatus Halobeggiatoa sp. HSG11]|nr:FMN-binding protein [Candidatus Halobeggiatoa sp. HSG11]